MRIGIDARMLGSGFGLARYVEQLVTLLEKHDTEHEYVIFLRKENWHSFEPSSDKFIRVRADIPWYSFKEQIVFPYIINKQHVDIMHFPHWNVPLMYNRPFVVTIHDLIMFHYPRPEATTHGRIVFGIKDYVHRHVVKHAVKKSAHIITTSDFTSHDIHDTLHISLKKMTHIYQAPFILSRKRHEQREPDVLKKFHIIDKYILYVGAAYPHKNVEKLVEAWHLFQEQYDDSYQLVLVGSDDYFWKRLKNSDIYKNTTQVIHTGYVSDHELASLYAHASLYVFPSLYEGFGLPPLEAIASNVPVASSHASCLPEVLNESAVFFDPTNAEHMAGVMAQVVRDPDLQMMLQQAGRARLQDLSPEKFVKETMGVYAQVLSSLQS